MIPAFLLLGTTLVCAQQEASFREGAAIPESVTGSTATIAAYIRSHASSGSDQVKMAYGWVITHITYDIRSRDLVILNEDRGILIRSALEKRRGVCENFAYLFADLCKNLGFPALVVGGYTRQNGAVDRSPHAWVAVQLDNEWALYDPTWDAADVRYSRVAYFRISPEVFIQTHMPFDPLLQFVNRPLSYDEFRKGRMEGDPASGVWDYKDSVAHYLEMSPLEQYLSAERRIQHNGTSNSMIDTKITQLKMEIEIIRQEEDSAHYQGAVNAYNQAVILLNDFINYRNNRFKPARSDSEVEALFSGMQDQITAAHTQIRLVNESKATLTLDTGGLEEALGKLEREISSEKDFYRANRPRR